MILGSPDVIREFLKQSWRKQPATVQAPLERNLALFNAFDGITPEILFDRAVRFGDREALQALGGPAPRLMGEAPIAWWATCQFRDEGSAIECLRVGREWDQVANYLGKLCSELGTPFDGADASFLVLPNGYKRAELALEAETFFFQAVGTGTVLGDFELSLGTLAYFPGGSRIKVESRKESVLIRFRLHPAPGFKLVLDHLMARLSSRPELCEPLTGILAFGDAHDAAKGRLDELLGAVRAELSGTKAEDVVRVVQSAPQRQFVPEPPPQDDGAPEGSPMYQDREWGIPGIARRPDDINIVTFRRSGTTWTQMVLYQLLTDGDLDKIEHIYEFSPFPTYELKILGSSARIDSMPGPRAIKTHLPFEWIYSTEGKFISVVRDGMDVALSAYHHHLEVGNGPVPFDVYFDRFLYDRRGWFNFVEGWWKNRDRPNVLFLTYRELKQDLAGQVHRISEFLGLKRSPKELARAVERSSFEYMKKHEAKFHHNRGVEWLHRSHETPGFIRSGKLSEGMATLTDDQRARFRARYAARLGHTGLKLDQ